MDMLAERIDAVIGVDTHTDTHTAAVCDARGGVLATVTVATTAAGYAELLEAAAAAAPGPRLAWAIEGTGSYGAGLSALLLAGDAEVIEIRAAVRPRGQGKNDTHDAIAIARAALAQTESEHARPRTGAVRDALALLLAARAADVATRTRLINAFKATVLKAPTWIRDRLRDLPTDTQIATAARLRGPRQPDLAIHYCLQVLQRTATQITALDAAIAAAEASLDELTATHAAPLRAEYGIGPVSAAQILIAWSHPGRIHSEAAFAALAGTSPLEASSGRTTRHRLNRTGDRQLNAALHRIVLTRRARHHEHTSKYIAKRTADGKTPREIQRCLKRYLARHLYRLLNTLPAMP
jgi:transposase